MIIKPQSVKVLTNEEWGQTWESNLQTMAWAAYACHEKDSVFENPEGLVKKWVFNAGHWPILEFSNVETTVNRIRNNDKLMQRLEELILRDQETIRQEGLNARNWRILLRKELMIILPRETDLFFSFRDLVETFEYYKFNDLKYFQEVLVENNLFINSKYNPQKRLMLLIETNQDTGHKLRTERSISQLSLTGTSIFKSIEQSKEPVFVSSSKELLKLLEDYLVDNYNTADKVKYSLSNIVKYLKPSVFNIPGLPSYTAKHFLNTYSRNIRVMAASVQDFERMCHKRMKSPEKKQDIIDLSKKILAAIEEWRQS